MAGYHQDAGARGTGRAGSGPNRFHRSGHDGFGDGRQHRPGRLPAHRLEPHRRSRPELADLGATFAATAAEVAAASDIVVVCVSDTPDVVEAVLFGPDGTQRAPRRAR